MEKEIKLAPNEKEIASIFGQTNSKAATIFLTSQRIYQETGVSADNKETKIIPIDKIDSFGLESYENKAAEYLGFFLLLLGSILFVFGSNREPIMGIIVTCIIAFAIILILIWALTKKSSINIVSVSGETKLAIEVTSENKNDLFNFLQKIQTELYYYSKPAETKVKVEIAEDSTTQKNITPQN